MSVRGYSSLSVDLRMTSPEGYLVLARKYRPSDFGGVLGQPQAAGLLQNAVSQKRVAHAYLFTGPRGVGKTTVARILAKALNCAKGPTPEPCGQCPSCVEIAASASLDVLEMDAASHTGVDNIREVIIDTVRLLPNRDRHKIFIIDEAHMLSQAAFNALLKTLEEPPPHVVFIMATTEASKIPATIGSRCQRLRFKPISPEALAQCLSDVAKKEGLKTEPEALSVIAQAAEGSLRDALGLLDQARSFCEDGVSANGVREMLGYLGREMLEGLASALLKRDSRALAAALQKIYEDGAEPAQVLRELRSLIEDIYLQKIGKFGDTILNSFRSPADPRIAPEFSMVSPNFLAFILRKLNAALSELRFGDSPRLVLDLALFGALEGGLDVENWISRLEALEKGGGGQRSSETASPQPSTPVSPAPGDEASLLAPLIAAVAQDKASLAHAIEGARMLKHGGGYRLVFSRSFDWEQAKRNQDILAERLSALAGQSVSLALDIEKEPGGKGNAASSRPAPTPDPLPSAADVSDPAMKEAMRVFGGRLKVTKKSA